MADLEKLTKNLTQEGFLVSRFATAEAACAYLNRAIDGASAANRYENRSSVITAL